MYHQIQHDTMDILPVCRFNTKGTSLECTKLKPINIPLRDLGCHRGNFFPVFPYLTTYTSEPKYNPYTNNIDRQVIGYHDEYESIDMKKFKRWNVRNMVNYVDNEESSVANGFGHQSRDKKDTTTATPVSLPVVTLSTNKLVPSPLYKSLAFQFLGSAKFKLRSDDVFSTPVLNFGDANANEQFYGNITDREELEMFLNEVSERSSARLDEDSSDLNVSAKQPK